MNKNQIRNLKELKSLSIIVPKRHISSFNSIIALFELGQFQNVKTPINLIQRLASRGAGPAKAIEKINTMQSALVKEQARELQQTHRFLPAISNLDRGIVDDEPTPIPVASSPIERPKLSTLITKKTVAAKPVAPKSALKTIQMVLKSYHITGDVICDIAYVKTTKSGKKYEVKPSETKYNPKSNDEHVFRDVTKEIFATSESEALSKFDDDVRSSFFGTSIQKM